MSWRCSDTQRVLDVVNPIDKRNFGMTDIEDIRIAVNMTMLDFYSKKIDLTIAVVHEYQEDKNRKLGSPYYHLKTK